MSKEVVHAYILSVLYIYTYVLFVWAVFLPFLHTYGVLCTCIFFGVTVHIKSSNAMYSTTHSKAVTSIILNYLEVALK